MPDGELRDEQMTSTLEQLDGAWPEPAVRTRLIERCHELRRKPLRDFTPEDCRILLGQKIAPNLLLPRALLYLRKDPFTEGDFYPGDLFQAALKVPREFWDVHPHLERLYRDVAQEALQRIEVGSEMDRLLRTPIEEFLAGPQG